MRNTVYFCLILFFNLHNVKSKKHDHTRSELKLDSKNPIRTGEKLDMSKFVDILLKDAKKIEHKNKKSRKRQRKTTEKTIKKTVDEGFESSYDSLGLDENIKDQIVQSNKPGLHLKKMMGPVVRSNTANLDLKKIGQIFRSNNQGLDYKKMRQILQSNAESKDGNMQKGSVLRSVDRPSEEGAALIFDLEDEDGLKNPLF